MWHQVGLKDRNSVSISCNSFQYMLNSNVHNTSTDFTLKAFDIVWPCLLEPMLKALRDIAIVASLPSTVFNIFIEVTSVIPQQLWQFLQHVELQWAQPINTLHFKKHLILFDIVF